MKTISIITPTLNSIKTIERNLLSVSNQNTHDIEQIIIDGYSDDGTRSLIQSYKGHNIIILDENERGIYQAINQGIKQAQGEFIMLLNSDDWLPDDAINTIIKKVELNEKNIHIFISDVYEDSKKIARLEPMKEFKIPIQKMPFSHGAMIAKRKFLLEKGLYSTRYSLSSDLDFVHKTIHEDYAYHNEIIHCFSLEGSSSQNYQGSKESMNIAICYGKNPFLAKLDYMKVVINKFFGRLIGFSRIIKLKKLLNYSTNWK